MSGPRSTTPPAHWTPPAITAAFLAMGVLTACGDDFTAPSPAVEPSVSLAATSLAFTQIGAGQSASCGLTAEGQAFCWGFNRDGELGNGSFTASRIPTPVAGGLVFRQISVGYRYACGVTTDNRAYCWGDNQWGQLGIGSTQPRAVPTPVSTTLRFQVITTFLTHSCALTAVGRKAYCWGSNQQGGLGDGTLTSRFRPVAVSGGRTWREISVGQLRTCAVTPTYQAYCWGSDRGGGLGDGPERLQRTTPTPVAGSYLFAHISVGLSQSCAVTTDHLPFCWGSGPTGDGRGLDRYTPRQVVGGLAVDRITAGGTLTCAETTANRTYCWGDNSAGQLGTGTVSDVGVTRPVEVVGGHRFVRVSAGHLHVCALDESAQAWCWGYNGTGELGNGTDQNSSVPTAVVAPG